LSQLLLSLDGFLWLLLALVILLYLQRSMHREVQAVLLLLTRNPGVTIAVFSLLFFPGVLLHEGSHFVIARLLGVRTGRFSVIPQAQADGRLRLGYVETARTGLLRDALIGAAPLILGMLFIAFASINRLHLVFLWDTLRTAQWDLFWLGLSTVPTLSDFWLWFYLTFAVSSTMLPSASDRRAWLPLALVAGVLLALMLLAGAGPWMLAHLAPPVNDFLRASALLLAVSVIIHALLIPPFWALHRLLARVTGLDIQ